MKQRPEQLHKRMRWQTVWNVVAEYATKQLPAEAVCRWLGVSRTQLYRLRQRWSSWQEKKPSAEWLYQRPDRKESRWRPEVQSYLKAECDYVKNQSPLFRGYFNFSFLAERVHRSFGIRLSRQAVRRWAIREGYFNPAIDKAAKAYVRFETGGIGMLFQHDASPHVWVPATQRRDVMIATIDDHSRKLVGALLVPTDTAWHNLCVVRETVESYGCPVAYYVDNGSIYRPDKEPVTQFGRALRSLEIDLKFTKVRHPQSKDQAAYCTPLIIFVDVLWGSFEYQRCSSEIRPSLGQGPVGGSKRTWPLSAARIALSTPSRARRIAV